jgi:hypothetical protein
MNAIPLVKGEISCDEEIPQFAGATMYVRLEKIIAADVAAEVVAEYIERDVAFNPKSKNVLSFTITGEAPDPRASYAVRVHIDIDKDREVSQGDLISTQSYPVITFGYPKQVSIIVRQVR